MYDRKTFSFVEYFLPCLKPVITNGCFTKAGHVVVMIGSDKNGYFVNLAPDAYRRKR